MRENEVPPDLRPRRQSAPGEVPAYRREPPDKGPAPTPVARVSGFKHVVKRPQVVPLDTDRDERIIS